MSDGPLAGLRVVSTSVTLTGAHIALFLADNGAAVVEIEPVGGSPLRSHMGYPFLGRGRSGVELDLRTTEGAQRARDLASDADVFVETWRPEVAERLGLGYDRLRESNPRLVYASVTGFGRIGRYARVKGYEALVMAKLGIMSALDGAAPRSGPVYTSMPYASWSAAQTALHGVLTALYQRESTGIGQRVDTTLLQAIAGHDTWNWYLHLVRERYPDAFSWAPAFDRDGVPSGPLQIMLLTALTADGRWLQFSQWQPHLFKAFMVALGLDWMYSAPEWTGLPGFEDAERRAAFWEHLLVATRKKTLAEWQAVFRADPNVWAETYRHGAEILEHPQLVAEGSIVTRDVPGAGLVRQLGPLVRRIGEVSIMSPPPAGPEIPSGSPLSGVTVLELGTFYAGPFAATLLADLGARVIKVEPLEGDPIRGAQPFPEVGGAKVTAGKESIAVDMSHPDGQRIVHDLARAADLVLQSYRPGVAQRQGVDAATLRAVNPALVYLHAPAYGVEGPCRRSPAFAPTIGAGAGIAMRNLGTSVAEHPDLSLAEIKDCARRLAIANTLAYAQADGLAGLGGATALLLGLLTRARTGECGEYETTMLRSAGHATGDLAVSGAGIEPPPLGNDELVGPHATYRLYPATDGWIFLAAPQDREWPALVAALREHRDLDADPRFSTAADRATNDAALAEALGGVFAAGHTQDWEGVLTAADLGCVAVSTAAVETVLRGPDFGHESGIVADALHPLFDTHPRLAPLVTLAGNPKPGDGCMSGQHTEAILTELGYTPDRITGLVAQQVVALG